MIRLVVILSLLQVVAFWKIFGRMGFPSWLAIMASIPLLNLLPLYFAAFSPWPSEGSSGGSKSDGTGPGDAKF